MDFKIRVKNGGHIYSIPEEMLLRPALAMIAGGTAERLDVPQVESTTLNRMCSTAARFIGPMPFFRVIGEQVLPNVKG